jgi:hypothetical protein
MQIRETRLLLEQDSGIVLQKAYRFINQAIEKTFQNWTLGGIQLEDMALIHGTSGSERQVSVLEYPVCTANAEL